jgi:hypothetical protein
MNAEEHDGGNQCMHASTLLCTQHTCAGQPRAHVLHRRGHVASWRRAFHHASHHDGRLAGAVRINIIDLHQLCRGCRSEPMYTTSNMVAAANKAPLRSPGRRANMALASQYHKTSGACWCTHPCLTRACHIASLLQASKQERTPCICMAIDVGTE